MHRALPQNARHVSSRKPSDRLARSTATCSVGVAQHERQQTHCWNAQKHWPSADHQYTRRRRYKQPPSAPTGCWATRCHPAQSGRGAGGTTAAPPHTPAGMFDGRKPMCSIATRKGKRTWSIASVLDPADPTRWIPQAHHGQATLLHHFPTVYCWNYQLGDARATQSTPTSSPRPGGRQTGRAAPPPPLLHPRARPLLPPPPPPPLQQRGTGEK